MKVLILNQIPEVNNKYTFSLARALKLKGVDVTVCGINDDNVVAYTDVLYLNIFENYSKLTNPLAKVLSYRKSLKKLLKFIKENGVDLVHLQWYIFSPLDYWFQKKLRKIGIKVVVTIHDLLPFNKKFYDFHYHKKIYLKADKVITQTTANQGPLCSKFDVPQDKIVYIPHGHYMDYAEKATKEESIEHLALPKDKKIILFFGQIKKVKGVDILIQAMRTVVDKHPNVLCVIAGKVWKDDFSTYDELIRKLNLNEFIKTDIKYIDDSEIKFYFNSADMVALPYRQIYQSGVVLLAYAYEKPVIATTEGEFLTVIKNEVTGLLVPSGDDKALAEAICRYIENPQEAEQFGIKGKEDLSVRLSWDNIAEQLKEVYSEICE